MENWSAHQFNEFASPRLGESKASELVRYTNKLRQRNLPVIFSLNHLSQITSAKYHALHETVNRKRESNNYRMYAIKKRSGGRRFIHAVASPLYDVQTFINKEILQRCSPHPNSYAFHSSGSIQDCAAVHCGARWLFQFDLKHFFYSISEIECFNVFLGFGYKPLLAFELARLCTTTRVPRNTSVMRRLSIGAWENIYDIYARTAIASDRYPYPSRSGRLGVLPQGAPSSPMLSNLAADELDQRLTSFAFENNLVYSRYADDLTFSAVNLKRSRSCIRSNVLNIIRQSGFFENEKKFRIAGPGSRKQVLGLLVDGKRPRISRAMYKRIDRLLHGALKYGFQLTAAHFGFDSAYGFHNHLSGLIAFVKSVDQSRWADFSEQLISAKKKDETAQSQSAGE